MKIQEGMVWVENLYDGTWIMKKFYNTLLGYRVKKDPCAPSEQDAEEMPFPTFKERAEELNLEPVVVECVGTLFD